MPANFPDRATMVSQSKFYIGLFLITACTLMLQMIQHFVGGSVVSLSFFCH
jgi:hypothetical protein